MVLAFADAWKLVQCHGLSRAAYYRMDYDTVRDTLYLLTQGVPVKKLVRILNRRGAKEKICRKRQELAQTYAAALKQSEYVLTASHLASVLAKLAPGALLAELNANEPQIARHAYEVWLKQPRKTRLRILSELPPKVLKDAWFDATSTVSAVKESVGPETIVKWLREN